MDDEQIALVAKALAHPARIQILKLLASQDECMGAQLFSELPLAQSTVSQHVSLLRAAGLVSSHAVGQGHVYCLCDAAVSAFADSVASISAGIPGCCPIKESR